MGKHVNIWTVPDNFVVSLTTLHRHLKHPLRPADKGNDLSRHPAKKLVSGLTCVQSVKRSPLNYYLSINYVWSACQPTDLNV